VIRTYHLSLYASKSVLAPLGNIDYQTLHLKTHIDPIGASLLLVGHDAALAEDQAVEAA
jgi:hypothetical protein